MELDSSFDVIVVGTGLTESIIAAAVARIGKTVLHLDSSDHYGSDWTSFSFSQIVDWSAKQRCSVDLPDGTLNSESDGERIVDCSDKISTISNVETIDYSIKEEPIEPESSEQESAEQKESTDDLVTFRKLLENDRKFNIDLCPRLLFSRGAMVDTLVHSNISRYLEFKAATRILTCSPDNELLDVPCSRCDIFTNKTISVIEKRMLMRFMSECVENKQLLTDMEDFKDRPFVEFLDSKNLSKTLQHFIVNAIAMCDESETTEKAIASLNQFLASLGRFGNSPFIFPLYGSGELPQAFCRLCAVFGGTYCLKRQVNAIVIDSNLEQVTDVITENQRIKCQYLVTSLSQTPRCLLPENLSNTIVSKAIFISNGSIKASNKQELTFLRLVPDGDICVPVNVLEVGNSVHVTPQNVFVVYCWCLSQNEDSKKDLLPVAKKLFNFTSENSHKPKLIWSCYYNQIFADCSSSAPQRVNSLFTVSPPSSELDYDFAISEAKKIFSSMFPSEEFLPRAPDPEEIILDEPQMETSENDRLH